MYPACGFGRWAFELVLHEPVCGKCVTAMAFAARLRLVFHVWCGRRSHNGVRHTDRRHVPLLLVRRPCSHLVIPLRCRRRTRSNRETARAHTHTPEHAFDACNTLRELAALEWILCSVTPRVRRHLQQQPSPPPPHLTTTFYRHKQSCASLTYGVSLLCRARAAAGGSPSRLLHARRWGRMLSVLLLINI